MSERENENNENNENNAYNKNGNLKKIKVYLEIVKKFCKYSGNWQIAE